VQAAIGRPQPVEQVAQAVEKLRAAGIAAINLDIMYGLPRQSVADAARTASLAAELKPNRLAAFGYAHVPWFKTRQRLIDEAALPGAAERLEQAEAMRTALVDAGYVEIGFDHYAQPDDPMAVASAEGRLQRNFQGYVCDEAAALIGLGASSISSMPQGYAQNAPEVGAWGRAIAAGQFATVRGRAVTDEDRRRRAIIERLLCDFALDLSEFGGWTGLEDAHAALLDLAADGLCTVQALRVDMPEAARPFVRLVAQAFDAYRPASAARHSRAV
jgi:oxygen-independent coproporphyrinogen-3 oxidase